MLRKTGFPVLRSVRLRFRLSLVLLLAVAAFLTVSHADAAFRLKRELKLESITPQGLIQGPAPLTLRFSAPVVRSEDLGKIVSGDGLPMAISPRVNGWGKWEDPLTFVYQSNSGLFREATEYTVEIKEGLTGLETAPFAGERKFRFWTPPLAFRGVKQTSFSTDHNYVDYELYFSLPVSPSKLLGFVSILDAKGEKVPYSLRYNHEDAIVYLRVEGGDGSAVSLDIAAGFTSERGPLGLESAVSLSVERDMALRVRNSNVGNDANGQYVYLELTAPVDVEKALSFIEVVPKQKIRAEAYGSTLRLWGDAFAPRTRVTLRLKKGLPPFKGPGLSEDWERAFLFPDLPPSLFFVSQGRFISPANEALYLTISVVNIEEAALRIRRVYDNNVPFAVREGWPYYVADLSELVVDKKYRLASPPNEKEEYSIDLKSLLGGRKGLFQVDVSREQEWESWPRISRIVNVTDIAGSLKLGEKNVLIWANSISRGVPMKDVTVKLYSSSHQVLVEGHTDADGLFAAKRETSWTSDLYPVMAVLQKDDDISVLRLEQGIWSRGDTEYMGEPYASGKFTGLCFTPRGVFRPGEQVPIQLLVRKQNLIPEKPFPVQLRVVSSTGRLWKTETLHLSDFGMAGTEIPLADAAPSGTWQAEVRIPGEETPFAATTFLVEDFAPPRISVATSSDRTIFRAEESAKLFINAQYLFGAPAGGLPYEVETTYIPREYTHPNWKGFRFSDDRIALSQRSGEKVTGTLSPEGDAELAVDKPDLGIPSILDIVLRAGVMEEGGRWVYRTLTLPYYPRDALLGIQIPEGTISTTSDTPILFAMVDIEGNPIDSASVKMSLQRGQRRNVTMEIDGRIRSESRFEYIPVEEYEDVALSMDKGTAKMDIRFKNGGSYMLTLDDAESGASAAIHFYVYNPEWRYEEQESLLPENLTLTLDKQSYRVGETASVQVAGGFAGTLLLTVETDSVLHTEVARMDKESGTYKFRVTEEMMPNAWVTAHLIRPVQPGKTWSAQRAFGAAPLQVDCNDLRLQVEVKAPEKIKPQERSDFSVRLVDGKGNGVPGEFFAMLVDEGVLTLTRFKTPNFYEKYTRRRALTLDAYDIYQDLLPLYLENPKLLSPGGGAGEDAMEATMKASLSPVKAERFKVLTLCKNVRTDEKGEAAFSFDVPEFSGKARLMVFAVSHKSFGAQEAFHTIARDIVAEVNLPRVMAPEDLAHTSIQLFNRTGTPMSADLEVVVEGPIDILKGPKEKKGVKLLKAERLELSPSENAVVVPIHLKAEKESGAAKISVTLKHGGDSFTQVIELAVRPPYPRISRSGYLVLKSGDRQTLTIPSDWFPGTRRANIVLSGLPSVSLADAANFLVTYPYGCLEQTISSGWALLSQPALVARIDPQLATREQLEYAIQSRLMRLQAMQYYNGSFSSWPRSVPSDWISVYATHFLLECEAEGYAIPIATKEAALSYLRYLIARQPSAEREYYAGGLAVRAYIAYVLAREGEPPLAWMSYLKENVGQMPAYGRLLLAATYAHADQKDIARTLLGDNPPTVANYEAAASEGLNFDSDLRTQALHLLAWTELDPTSANAVKAAGDMLDSLRKYRYYTTQEASFAMQALAKFFLFHKDEGKAILALKARGETVAVASNDALVSYKAPFDTNAFQLTNSGDGSAYVTWIADGVPLEKPQQTDKGLQARVRFHDAAGRLIQPGTTISRGERLTGTITLIPTATRASNIVVTLPFAAGLEVENPNLMDPAEIYDEPGNYRNARSELRDDRLLLFVDEVTHYPTSPHWRPFTWTFSMRAVTAGTYILPPIAAEGMYAPGMRSIGDTSNITIQ